MLSYYHAVREMAQRIAGAIDASTDALREARVEQEPAMTDRMLGSIEHSVEGFRSRGIRWTAKTLTDRGRGSQESKYGADFMGVLQVSLRDFTVSKGFLAQAKLVRRRTVDNPKNLKEQCEKMLALSPASFVFVYGYDGVRVFPALSVVGSGGDLADLYSRSGRLFFEEHLECFIGDRAIHAPSPATLDDLRDRYEARDALLLRAETDEAAAVAR